MNRVLLSLVIVAFATATAQAVHPAPDPLTTASFQAILDTTGGGGTYYDLDEVNAPDAVTGWGFPDGSDDTFTVNGNVADEKGNTGEDFAMTLSLSPNTTYSVDVVIFDRTGATFDVSGGFVSGSLTNFVSSDGTRVTNFLGHEDPDPLDTGLARIALGAGTSDGAGNLVVYLGGVDGFNAGRTEIDGLIATVIPEPSTALLACMGLLGLFCRGKRRSA